MITLSAKGCMVVDGEELGMCRSVVDGYRRCPGCSDPGRRAIANIRNRIGRHERSAAAARKRELWDKVEHYIELLDRACAEHDELTEPDIPELPPTRAEEFSPEAADGLTDDELTAAVADCASDPEALDAILARLEERQPDEDEQPDADEQQRALEAAERRQATDDVTTPLDNPARRSARGLTARQQCREEYDAFVAEQYVQAETDCRGVLLNKLGQARGIHPAVLFEGPAWQARKYASEELKQWWGRDKVGRVPYVLWRWRKFGWPSDREPAMRALRQSVGEAAA